MMLELSDGGQAQKRDDDAPAEESVDVSVDDIEPPQSPASTKKTTNKEQEETAEEPLTIVGSAQEAANPSPEEKAKTPPADSSSSDASPENDPAKEEALTASQEKEEAAEEESPPQADADTENKETETTAANKTEEEKEEEKEPGAQSEEKSEEKNATGEDDVETDAPPAEDESEAEASTTDDTTSVEEKEESDETTSASDDAPDSDEPQKKSFISGILAIFIRPKKEAVEKPQVPFAETALKLSWIVFISLVTIIILWLLLTPAPNIGASPPDRVPILSMGIVQSQFKKNVQTLSKTDSPPYIRFAHPFSGANSRTIKKIAVIVYDLGLREDLTKEAIYKLPAGVTLAFSPYAKNLDHLLKQAYSQGHEVVIQLPMEPLTYPDTDPGPATLLTNATESENTQKYNWIASKAAYNVGLLAQNGSRFLTSPKDMKKLIQQLNTSGYLFVDNKSSLRSVAPAIAGQESLPFAQAYKNLKLDMLPDKMLEALKQIKRTGESKEKLVVLIQASPTTINMVRSWVTGVDFYPMNLAPISAVVEKTNVKSETEEAENAHPPQKKDAA